MRIEAGWSGGIMTTRWEYCIRFFGTHRSFATMPKYVLEALNKEGARGWELVTLHVGNNSHQLGSEELWAIFKRPFGVSELPPIVDPEEMVELHGPGHAPYGKMPLREAVRRVTECAPPDLFYVIRDGEPRHLNLSDIEALAKEWGILSES